jgi:hypothetical protein
MYDVSTTAVFVASLLNTVLDYFQVIFIPLVTISVAPMITAMTKLFIFHIHSAYALFFFKKGTYSPSRTFGLP